MQSAETARHVVPFQAAARELGLRTTTLRRMCRDGEGPTLLQISTCRLATHLSSNPSVVPEERSYGEG